MSRSTEGWGDWEARVFMGTKKKKKAKKRLPPRKKNGEFRKRK
jgi:hypothetical protein